MMEQKAFSNLHRIRAKVSTVIEYDYKRLQYLMRLLNVSENRAWELLHHTSSRHVVPY